MGLNKLTIAELQERLLAGEVSATEIVRDISAAREKIDERLNAYLNYDPERSLKMAGSSGGEYLAGIPVAVKDNICVEGEPTTCASKILESYKAVYDATVTSKLRQSGALPLGKTNLDEFAMGSSTENSAFGPTRNPRDEERVPGGSSGGSAAAVAGDIAICALGSDTGGSIRQPAAFCGVVGMKPTYGLVSRYGLVAFASSLDQIGPITKTVEDSALLLKAIAGHDPMDSTSVRVDIPDYTAALGTDLKRGTRVAIVKELSGEGIDKGVVRCFSAAVERLAAAGIEVDEVTLPSLEYALPAYYLIAPAEASANLARFDGVRYGYRYEGSKDMLEAYKMSRSLGFGSEVKRRIMLGTYALSAGYYEAYYGKAQQVRTVIIKEFNKVFENYSALLSPTTPTTAFRIGEKVDDPLKMYLSDICTIPANLAGLPAISVPCGLADGLPVGLQIMAKHFDETTLFRLANMVEREVGKVGKPV